MSFKVGDWIIFQYKKLNKGNTYPREVVMYEQRKMGINEVRDCIYVKDGSDVRCIQYNSHYRLATESEIKKEKIRSIFKTKRPI